MSFDWYLGRLHLTKFRTVEGNGYFISTAFTSDNGLETMIFHAVKNEEDKEFGCDITDYYELYAKRYSSQEYAIAWHNALITMPAQEFLDLLKEESEDTDES